MADETAPPDTSDSDATASAVVPVRDLDWTAIRAAVDPVPIRARMRSTVERMEALLDSAGASLLFDTDRASDADRVIQVSSRDDARALWIIGDLHGDLLALEASLALVRRHADEHGGVPPQLIFLG